MIDEFGTLEQSLREQGVELRIAALPRASLTPARRLPRWAERDAAGRLLPTPLVAVRDYRAPTEVAQTEPEPQAGG